MMITGSQRLRTCKALARAARHEHLIGAERPEREFFREVESPTCSTSEWLLLKTAHAVWAGMASTGPSVGLMLLCLSDRELTLIGELLQAFAATDDRALEAWLARAGFPRLEAI